MTQSRRLSSWRRIGAVAALAMVWLVCPLMLAAAELPEGWRTTDDTRRVPLPPRDDSQDPVLVIDGGTLIDGTGGKPVPDSRVVIRGTHIVAAGARDEVPMPDRVDAEVDAGGLFVVPGLIDLHIHFTQQRGDDFGRYRDSAAAAAIRGTLLAKQLIDAGITAVRDVGTSDDVALRIKEAVHRGMIDGPRVLWSGRMISSRGGHGNEITSTATGRPKSLEDGARKRVANGPWDWRLAVREQLRMHADWIKITAPYTREEVQAAADEAHMHGFRVAVDSFGKYTAWASEAGIDTIEHPLKLDSDIIDVMADNGTAFVPTITAFYNVLTTGYPTAGISGGGFFHTHSRRFPTNHEQHIQMVREAHEAGVPIGVGTDIPFENERRYPGSYHRELGFLKDAGMSDEEVLAAATRVGADILGLPDKLGTVEDGKLADILIVGADPLDDIQNLRDVRHVIANGRKIR
ncbi:amidohydrolase family protein [Elongatibacter sediminis]|uniref:Amidohydrolase family protein n=1 Tax=Elongatibacter sediminis TaxID=3119006 RepID=A0AAW9RFE6_9GAMM